MNKKAIWVTASLLLVYFIFTSGLYYWASRCEETDKLITPYSFALSGGERGFTGIATKSDIDCIKWLLKEGNPNYEIAGDSNANYLLMGYFVLNDTKISRLVSLGQFYKAKHCYLLLTQHNIQDGVFTFLADVGLRVQYPFTISSNIMTYEVFDITQSNYRVVRSVAIREVYRSGDSVVVERQD